MMVSGPPAVFDPVQGELARMTGRLEYLGARGDLAAANKLFGNALIIGLGGTVADVLSIAAGAQVDAVDAVKLLGLLDLNAMTARIGGAMAQRDFTPTFELSMARKDVALMLKTAGERPMAALSGVAARMDQLIGQGHGHAGTGIMAKDAV
jgi:3-hydroxyisobutyrate dehydrogenase-like beta-hydroxyacid dehydrogenase